MLNFKAILLFNSLVHGTILLPKKQSLLPTNDKIKGLIRSQNGANIHTLVPTYLQDPAINLYTSVVDLIYFCRLVESPLYMHVGPVLQAIDIENELENSKCFQMVVRNHSLLHENHSS